MIALLNLHNGLADKLEGLGSLVLPTLARFTFAASLFGYFWASALTKTGAGLFGVFSPSLGAYAQIFPKAMEAAGYDVGQLGAFHALVVISGTVAEFLLPLLIVIGLFTRLTALGMIGFVAVQTLTDLFGHNALQHPETLGAWFDRIPDSLIMDQRLFWMVVLITLVIKGAGPLSMDRLLKLR